MNEYLSEFQNSSKSFIDEFRKIVNNSRDFEVQNATNGNANPEYEAQEVAFRDQLRQVISDMKTNIDEVTEVTGEKRNDTDLIKEEINLKIRQIGRELRVAQAEKNKLAAGDSRHVYYGDLIGKLGRQRNELQTLGSNIDSFMQIFNDLDDRHNRLNRYVDVAYDTEQLDKMAELTESIENGMGALAPVERVTVAPEVEEVQTVQEPTPMTVEPLVVNEPVVEEVTNTTPEVTPVVEEKVEQVQQAPTNVERRTEVRWASGLSEEQILDALERGIDEPKGQEYEQFLAEHGIANDNNGKLYGVQENINWASGLTEEQIMDALSRDIYEPVGQEYEQFLAEHGIPYDNNGKPYSSKFIRASELEKKDEVKPVEPTPVQETQTQVEEPTPEVKEVEQPVEQPETKKETGPNKEGLLVYTWDIIKNEINDRASVGLDEEQKSWLEEVISRSGSRYTANMDTISLSDKFKALHRNNKINMKKKYGLAKILQMPKNLTGYIGVAVSSFTNKVIRTFNEAQDVDIEAWARYKEAVRSLPEDKKEWMYQHIGSLSSLSANLTPIQADIVCDMLKDYVNKKFAPIRKRYLDNYYAILDLGAKYLDDPTTDISAADRMIAQWYIDRDQLDTFYTAPMDRLDSLRYDSKSRMSLPGQHFAAKNDEDFKLQATLAGFDSKIQSAAMSNDDASALLHFMKYQTKARSNSHIKKTLLGEKFEGGKYFTTEVGALNHERDTFYSDMVGTAFRAVALTGMFMSVAQKLNQAAELKRVAEVNNNVNAANNASAQTASEAITQADNLANGTRSNIDAARQGYYNMTENAILSNAEIGGQSAAALGNGQGKILSFQGEYAKFDPQMHTVSDQIVQHIEALKNVTTSEALTRETATLYDSMKVQLNTILDAMSSTTNVGPHQLERYNAMKAALDSMPTVESFYTNTEGSLGVIDEILKGVVEGTQYMDAENARNMLNFIPELMIAGGFIGSIATQRKQNDPNFGYSSQDVDNAIDNVNETKLDDALFMLENSRGR